MAGVPFLLASLDRMTPSVTTTLATSSLLVAPFGLQAWFPGTACSLNCPSWSISVEAFFYLMLPFLLAPIMRNPLKGLFATLGCWLAATAVFMWVWATVSTQGSIPSPQPSPTQEIAAQWIKYFPPGRLPEFCLGLVLCALWKRQPQRFNSSLKARPVELGAECGSVTIHRPLRGWASSASSLSRMPTTYALQVR
jgi:peptidoglycan/LPS O-acetylase OafA/YrhL